MVFADGPQNSLRGLIIWAELVFVDSPCLLVVLACVFRKARNMLKNAESIRPFPCCYVFGPEVSASGWC
jgi:hypothetical protein